MKIEKISIKGYKGIYNGLGLKELNVDLSKSIHKIIMIKGDNGSGKSTFYNALDMFPANYSDLIPNMDCHKKITYRCDGIRYDVDIAQKVTSSGPESKAYLYKYTDEGKRINLNPSGLIKSYEKAVYDEFKLNKTYLDLSKISSENKGLIELKPADRKKLISSITEETIFYNNIHKRASNLVRDEKAKLDYLNSSIDASMRKSDILESIKLYEQVTEKLSYDISDLNVKIGECNAIINDSENKSILYKISTLEDEIRTIGMSIYESHTHILDILNENLSEKILIYDLNDLKEFIEYHLKRYNKARTQISSKVSEYDIKIGFKADSLNEYNKELEELTAKMNLLQNSKTVYDESVEFKNKCLEENLYVESKLSKYVVDYLMSSEEYAEGIEVMKEIESSLSDLKANYDYKVLKDACDLYKLSKGNYFKYLEDSSEELANHRKKHSDYKTELSDIMRNIELKSRLNLRPKECRIDTCEYIKDYINLPDLKQLAYSKNHLKNKISDIENKINILTTKLQEEATFSRCMRDISQIINLINSKVLVLNKLNLETDLKSTEGILDAIVHTSDYNEYDRLREGLEYSRLLKMYNENLKTISRLDESISNLKDNIINYDITVKSIDEIKEKISTIKSQIDLYKEELSAVNAKNEIVERGLSKLEISKEMIDECILNDLKTNEISKEIQKLIYRHGDVLDIQKDYINYSEKLSNCKEELKVKSEELSKAKLMLEKRLEYEEKFNFHQDRYKKLKIIQESTSPTKGIQTLIASNYIGTILRSANSLLSELFEGKFKIDNFVINEKEFRIPVIGNNIRNEDISEMSTSQKCMLSLIISLAILDKASIKYNIFKLDEIDGGLDNTNRGLFVEVLYRLIDLLSAEQVFMISHNNEMSLNDCDLILFKSNDTYNAGNIIYNYNK